MSNTRNPFSIFTGQQNQLRLLTQSHGIVRPNLVDSFDFTPKLSVKRVAEFDNPVDALIYQTFDGGTGKVGFMESNQGQIAAAMMDVDATVEQIMLDPAFLQPFDLFMNLKGQDGKIKASAFLYGCQLSGIPFTQTTKEGAKRTLDFECINGIILYGAGLLYTRARGSSGTQQANPAVPSLATSTTAGFLAGGDTIYVVLTAITAQGETAGSQEAAINVPTGTSTNKVTVTVPATAGSITGYNIYCSNRSNGERFVGTTATTSFVITALPAPQSVSFPRVNTSGVFVAAGDAVMTGSGPWSSTLLKNSILVPPSNLGYGLVKRDGVLVASPDNPATQDTFLISADGTTFSVNEDPTGHWWDLLTPFQP